jgi:hypothetical protein
MQMGGLRKAKELLEAFLRILEELESPFAQLVGRNLKELLRRR